MSVLMNILKVLRTLGRKIRGRKASFCFSKNYFCGYDLSTGDDYSCLVEGHLEKDGTIVIDNFKRISAQDIEAGTITAGTVKVPKEWAKNYARNYKKELRLRNELLAVYNTPEGVKTRKLGSKRCTANHTASKEN